MLTSLDEILDAYPDGLFLKADGFDEAVIGLDKKRMRLIYSIEKIINILKRDMDEEDAWEYFYFNIEGAYMGSQTPVYR